MITIKNLHKEKPSKPYDIKVDRTSILGNPYYLSNEEDRDKVCDKYNHYFNNLVSDLDQHKKFKLALDILIKLYQKYGKLNLFCWCAPKRCHVEIIKQYLEEKLGLGEKEKK